MSIVSYLLTNALVAVLFVAAMLILKSPRMYTSGLFERPCKVFLSVSKLALWFSLGGLYIFPTMNFPPLGWFAVIHSCSS